MPSLHLIDAASPQACPTTLALLADQPDRGPVLLLGGQPLARAADAAGLRDVARVGMPGGQPLLNLPALARQMRQAEPFDHVDAWSPASFAAAGLLRPRCPRRLTLTQPLAPKPLTRLARQIGRARAAARLRALTETIAADLLAAGLPASAIETADPRLNLARLDGVSREDLRSRWNVADATRVVALLSDPADSADAAEGAMAAALVREALRGAGREADLALLVHPAQHRRPRAERRNEQQDRPIRILQEPGLASPWSVLAGCDAAICPDPRRSRLGLLWALAAGCPVVAVDTPETRGWLGERGAALLALSDRSKALAHQLHRLLTEPETAETLVHRGLALAGRAASGSAAPEPVTAG
ncbi:MAG: hypothetical protein ACLFV3_12320 [Phycisphaeraceae bacterium]